ncbi:MAG: ferritin-like domain-containing protein [Myxococcaceae bacterium]
MGKAPAAAVIQLPIESRARQMRARGGLAFKLFGVALAGVFATGVISGRFEDVYRPFSIAFALFSLVAFAGFVQGIRALAAPGPGGSALGIGVLTALFPVLGGAFLTLIGVVLSLTTTADFSRGRQLRRRGRILLPPVAPSNSGEAASPIVHRDGDAIAAQWRENGRTEHASVAAFARLTLDLMALNAPRALLEAAQQDALDEIAHTGLCFSLATAFDGRALGPGEFPEAVHVPVRLPGRRLRLAQLAVDSLIDGALHEGLSAAVIARLAQRCTEPRVKEVLLQIAADEGRHAAHGWDVVEWCLREGGATVLEVLRGAALVLPEKMDTRRSPTAESGAWESAGIHGAALEAAEYEKMRHNVLKRLGVVTRRG